MPTVRPVAAPPVPPAPAAADATAHPAVGAATGLLDAYRPGDRFLATPTRTLLARGPVTDVPDDGTPLPERVRTALQAARRDGNDRPVVLGAVPFDTAAPAALAIPQQVRTGPPLQADPLVTLPANPPEAQDWKVIEVPAPEEYARATAEAVARMTAGEAEKVVLARTLEVSAPGREPDLAALLGRLARFDPSGHTFALPVGPGRTLLGASPELLVARRGGRLVANPLAGSAARSADLAEDVRRAAALLDSAKDLHEHAVVVEQVRRAMAPYCSSLDVPARPALVRTATMWHLSTTVTGTLADPDTTALDVAVALHPTPAVCGTPTAAARRMIADVEPFDRGFYTGMLGWQDASGDGEWVVTLRCAEAVDGLLRLYAGAGVVPASDPLAETAETAAKFRTFLSAVGASL
ncbi:isochorismate synthase [Streptomyces erythrochromogenes]|uniref:isochorismate synthase n=1 Tax=Streptomyces erythrochromogenes TaxID=285574 RepID=UPI003D9EC756